MKNDAGPLVNVKYVVLEPGGVEEGLGGLTETW